MRDVLFFSNIAEYYHTAEMLRRRFPQVRITDISQSFNAPTLEITIQKQESNPHIPAQYFQFLFDSNLEEYSAYARCMNGQVPPGHHFTDEYKEIVDQLYKGKVSRIKL